MAILLESPLFFRVNLLRCLRISKTLPGGLVTRGEVSQVWVRQLRWTRGMQEVWLPIRESRAQGISFPCDLAVPRGSARRNAYPGGTLVRT